MNNVYKLTLDIKRQQNVTIHRTVVGDTAVIFEIKVTDGGVPVLLDAVLNKIIAVFERPDHKVYTQDKDTGVSFADGTSTVTIAVSPTSFRAGRNTIELQIYTRAQGTDEVYPDLVTTEKGIFNARAATLRADAPNAPSQLPMLEQLISDAQAAVAAANAAAEAAAAEAQNAGNLVINVVNPYWNGNEFEGYADKTTEEVVAAIDAGKTIAVRIADADDETVYTMIEAYSSPDAHEVRCESKQAYCTVYAIGSTVQIHGALRVISEDDVE